MWDPNQAAENFVPVFPAAGKTHWGAAVDDVTHSS